MITVRDQFMITVSNLLIFPKVHFWRLTLGRLRYRIGNIRLRIVDVDFLIERSVR